jgi:hypothetical protein
MNLLTEGGMQDMMKKDMIKMTIILKAVQDKMDNMRDRVHKMARIKILLPKN